MKSALALAALLGGCVHGGDDPEHRRVEVVSMPVTPGTKLDILLVIDDSASVAHLQVSLAASFDTLLAALEARVGPLDLHIGVTTSDYGTAALADPLHPALPLGQIGNGGCSGVGKDGALVTSGAAVIDAFLVDGPERKNYTGTRHDVLAAMFRVGSGGCGFEQPLAASERAFANPANAGFRRDEANLLVLFLQDEDDCTLRDVAMLGPESPTLGPLQSFRCTRFGIVCDEDPGTLGVKTNCRAREDSPYLVGVQAYADRYRALVSDPARLVVGVLAGSPAPVEVVPVAPPGGGTPIASLGHSCRWTGASETQINVADPPVRMQSLIEAIGVHGSLTSACSQDFGPSLIELGRVAKQMFGVACLDTTQLLDSSGELGAQPACTATMVIDRVAVPLPRCPADGACFEVVEDPVLCPETDRHMRFVINDGVPAGAYVRASCLTR